MTDLKPYYADDWATIYCGDCRTILPSLGRFDLCLTDPPYGMEFQSNHRTVKHAKIHGDSELPIDAIWLAIGKSDVAAYVFCRWDNLHQMPKPKSVIAWVKNNWSMGDL
jgi:site-specific DNA-methyltransferase (adenine-specific)